MSGKNGGNPFALGLADLRRAASRATFSSGRGGGGGGGGHSRRDGSERDNGDGRGGRDGGGGGRRDGGRGAGQGGGWNRPEKRRRHWDDDNRDRRPRPPPLADAVRGAAEAYRLWQDSSRSGSGGSDDEVSDVGRGGRHLALLFLTIDDLPHEDIWRAWLDGDGTTAGDGFDDRDGDGKDGCEGEMTVSVLCHAKYPERVRSPWLRRRLLLRREESPPPHRRSGGDDGRDCDRDRNRSSRFHTRRPEWGSVEIARGMIDLLEEGLRVGEGKRGGVNGGIADGNTHTNGNADANANGAKRWAEETGTTDSDDDVGQSSVLRYVATLGDGDGGAVVPPAQRFLFASESCLPVATRREVELALFGPRPKARQSAAAATDADAPPLPAPRDESAASPSPYEKSWIHARSTPNNGYARQLQWDRISGDDIPETFVWKADQWMCLTRTHGIAVARWLPGYLAGEGDGDGGGGGSHGGRENGGTGGGKTPRLLPPPPPPLWKIFRNVRASDEMYFPTALAILGVLRRPPPPPASSSSKNGGGEADRDFDPKNPRGETGESIAGPEIRRRRITRVDWSVGAKNPRAFACATRGGFADAVAEARSEGCLFSRKFSKPTTAATAEAICVDSWREAVARG